MADPITQLIDALEMAKTGLQWYRGMMPEYVDGSDREADRQIDAALAAARTLQAAGQAEQPQEALTVPAGCKDESECQWHPWCKNDCQKLAAPTQAEQPAQQTDLHAAILNLPCVLPDNLCGFENESERESYMAGHRDARHAAAELVAALPQQPAQQAPQGARMPLTEAVIVEHAKQVWSGLPEHWWADDRNAIRSCVVALVRAAEAAHGISLPPAAQGEKKQ